MAARADIIEESVATIARLHDALVETAAIEPPLLLNERYARLAPVVVATHDLDRMARYAAGRAWRGWSESDQARFAEAFGRLSIATYASRFAGIGRENFEILGAEPDRGEAVRVHALIHRSDDDPVALDYVLEREAAAGPDAAPDSDTAGSEAAAGPRIVMVYNDGVSELSMRRSEYSAILEAGSLDDLLAEIEAQIAKLD